MGYANNLHDYPLVQPVYADLQALWRLQGKPVEALDKAIDATNARTTQQPSANRLNEIVEANQVLAFAYANPDCHPILVKHGFAVTNVAVDYDPKTSTDTTWRAQIDDAIAIVRNNVAAFPTSQQDEAFVNGLIAWIQTVYHPKKDCSIEATALEALAKQCGFCTEVSNVYESIFQRAGLATRRLVVDGLPATVDNYINYALQPYQQTGHFASHVLIGVVNPNDASITQVDGLRTTIHTTYPVQTRLPHEVAMDHYTNLSGDLQKQRRGKPEADFGPLRIAHRKFGALDPYNPAGRVMQLVTKDTIDSATNIGWNKERQKFQEALAGEPDGTLALMIYDRYVALIFGTSVAPNRLVSTDEIITELRKLHTTHPKLANTHAALLVVGMHSMVDGLPTGDHVQLDRVRKTAQEMTIAVATEAITMSPKALHANAAFEIYASNTGDFATVVEAYRGFVQRYPTSALYHYLLGKMLVSLSSHTQDAAESTRLAGEALVHAKEAIRIEPDHALIISLHLSTLIMNKQFTAAKDALKAAPSKYVNRATFAVTNAMIDVSMQPKLEAKLSTAEQWLLRLQKTHGARAPYEFMASMAAALQPVLFVNDGKALQPSRKLLKTMERITGRFIALYRQHDYWPLPALVFLFFRARSAYHRHQLPTMRATLQHGLQKNPQMMRKLASARMVSHHRALMALSWRDTPLSGYREHRTDFTVQHDLGLLDTLPFRVRTSVWSWLVTQGIVHGDMRKAETDARALAASLPMAGYKTEAMLQGVIIEDIAKSHYSVAVVNTTDSRKKRLQHLHVARRGLTLYHRLGLTSSATTQREWLSHMEAIATAFDNLRDRRAARRIRRSAQRQQRAWNS